MLDLTVKKIFENRSLAVATMHGKEKVIGPVLEDALGVKIVLPSQFNSDQFGTFSGEVERKLSPLEAARKKCLLAAELTGASLVVASEGSFGPHPAIYFVPADEEILLFMDLKNQLEYKVKKISTETNFSQATCKNLKEVMTFASKALFPSHALILKGGITTSSSILKGVQDPVTLEQEANIILTQFGQVHIETDMRAMYNPSRMKVIKDATDKLVQLINTPCPACGIPGFEIVEAKPGLPCNLCGAPTNSTLSYIRVCQQCHFSAEEQFPHGKQLEDPQYCNSCNP